MTETCEDCGLEMEKASIGAGAYIGWFCYQCEKFYPLENLDIGETVEAV